MIKIAICDDDEQFVRQLERYLLDYAKKKEITVNIYPFFGSEELFSSIQEEGLFDILFLDIELTSETGIDIGRRLRSDLKNEVMQIVYVSVNEQYALQLFNIRPMNFLVKPVDYQKVAYIMDEYERLFQFHNTYFTYNIGKRKYKMNENYILYFQSQGKKIQMVTKDGTEEFYGKLSDIIPQLSMHTFCVVHKSFVINMRYVERYRNDSILMTNGDEIPISQSMKQGVKEKLLEEVL